MPVLLIVEDNLLFRSSLREALGRRYPSLVITEASDVTGALLQFQEGPPDLALLDIQLPDGNGLDLAATILLDWPEVPVAICTSHDLPEYREVASRIGTNSFLVKQHLDWEAFGAFINEPRASRMEPIIPEGRSLSS